MPRARTDINWDAVKVIWLEGQHTSEELGAIFGISADGIRGRAFRERWNELKRVKQDKTAVLSALPEVRLPASSDESLKERRSCAVRPRSEGESPSRPNALSTSSRRRTRTRFGSWTASPGWPQCGQVVGIGVRAKLTLYRLWIH
jgi:hypothetical protein